MTQFIPNADITGAPTTGRAVEAPWPVAEAGIYLGWPLRLRRAPRVDIHTAQGAFELGNRPRLLIVEPLNKLPILSDWHPHTQGGV